MIFSPDSRRRLASAAIPSMAVKMCGVTPGRVTRRFATCATRMAVRRGWLVSVRRKRNVGILDLLISFWRSGDGPKVMRGNVKGKGRSKWEGRRRKCER